MTSMAREHPSFDSDFYSLLYPEYRQKTAFPLLHYLLEGWENFANPSPWFNTRYYLLVNEDARQSSLMPLEHYETKGRAMGYCAYPKPSLLDCGESWQKEFTEDLGYYLAFRAGLFNPEYYLQTYTDLDSGVFPLRHYRTHGFAEGRNPSALFNASWYYQEFMGEHSNMDPLLDAIFRSLDNLESLHELLDGSICAEAMAKNLFDPDFYLYAHPELADANCDFFLHYVFLGYRLGYNPTPTFNTKRYYIENQPHNGQNPILHCLAHETDSASACFYARAKIEELPDYALAHIGEAIGYLCEKENLLDEDWYLTTYEDVRESGARAAPHFSCHGFCEGRNPSAKADGKWYADEYLAGDASCIPLWHYLVEGRKLGFSLGPCEKTRMLEKENEELLKQLFAVQVALENMTIKNKEQPAPAPQESKSQPKQPTEDGKYEMLLQLMGDLLKAGVKN